MSRTKEENILIKRILTATTYYGKLGVKNDASDKDIATACRKLLLKVHPDKCKHPRSKEATQVLIRAYKTLERKRREYDESLRAHTTFDVSTVHVSDEDILFLFKGLGIGLMAFAAGVAVGVLLNWLFGSDKTDVKQKDPNKKIEENIEQESSTEMQNEKTPSNKRKREETYYQQEESNEKVEKDMKDKSNLKKKRTME